MKIRTRAVRSPIVANITCIVLLEINKFSLLLLYYVWKCVCICNFKLNYIFFALHHTIFYFQLVSARCKSVINFSGYKVINLLYRVKNNLEQNTNSMTPTCYDCLLCCLILWCCQKPWCWNNRHLNRMIYIY